MLSHPCAAAAAGIVQRDSFEWLKRKVFQKLNELARSKDIAVIFQVMKQEDPVTDPFTPYYQSIGPTGDPDMCLFCGCCCTNSEGYFQMGGFVADPQCHYDMNQPGSGTTFLERDDHRPDVIIMTVWYPGALDDAILDLAWGLAATFQPQAFSELGLSQAKN
jgi:hypothetical protein